MLDWPPREIDPYLPIGYPDPAADDPNEPLLDNNEFLYDDEEFALQ